MSSVPEQIFLSYSRNDKEAASRLRNALVQEGFTVFRDVESIQPGENWVKRLQDAVQQCSIFVLLVGHTGVEQERWVGAEAFTALSRRLSPHDSSERLPIFPVLLPEAIPEHLPAFLQQIQAVLWHPDSQPYPADLLDALQQYKQLPTPEPKALLTGEPYKGLSFFRREDADRFFGRTEEVFTALQKLGRSHTDTSDNPQNSYYKWLQVLAGSGVGKSSFVRAGLLPQIEIGFLSTNTGFTDWIIPEPMIPGKQPLTMLAEKLARVFPKRDLRGWLNDVLSADASDFALALRSELSGKQAVLLVVDQFEELFTQSEPGQKQQFDRVIAAALHDQDCPFFLITTVRSDFLDRFTELPALMGIYNWLKCDYLLPVISEGGLREVILAPARLSGLGIDNGLVEAIVRDSKGEPGVLPLVENALTELWHEAKNTNSKALSKAHYEQHNGVVGMLAEQADTLINSLGKKGRKGALNLLLALTQVNEGGRHTRRRLLRDDAVHEAGGGKQGERIVLALSGERGDQPEQASQPLRLVVTGNDGDDSYVELVHEMLVRGSDRTDEAGNAIGYWPTLYQYVHDNRDRDSLRQQLQVDAQRWQRRKWLGRYFGLAGFSKLRQHKSCRPRGKSDEGRYLRCSRWVAWAQSTLLVGLLVVFVESAWWTTQHNFPLPYIFIKPLWGAGLYKPLPEMVRIPAGRFEMGCKKGRDLIKGMDKCPDEELPLHDVTLDYSFDMGQYEVTFLQYDYYLWHQGKLDDASAPNHENWGRFNRPVIHVTKEESSQYTSWLGSQITQVCSLPSEAEWEYAARANSDTVYPWGNSVGKNNTNCRNCGSKWDKKQTAPVGYFAANAFGLYDTHGNVMEWVQDCHDHQIAGYEGFPVDGTANQSGACNFNFVRGGSFITPAGYTRSSSRRVQDFPNQASSIGFRVFCFAPTSPDR